LLRRKRRPLAAKHLPEHLAMNLLDFLGAPTTRRTFLTRASGFLGGAALATLARADSLPGSRGIVNPLHFAPKAKRIIWLYQSGGPSHFETFDNKPKLAELHGKDMPESFTKGQPIAQLQNQKLRCFGPQFGFQRFGQSGQEICELFPQIGSVADELCIVRSMKTEAINHDPAHTFMNTGTTVSGRPSMGAWLLYGLGTESENLPGFIVLVSTGRGGQSQPISARQWHSGFLPSRFQGVKFQSKGEAVYYVSNPPGVTPQREHDVVEAVNTLNRVHAQATDDPEIATRIAQYEMAFKMQTSVPELVDLRSEPKEILEMYGTTGDDGTYAANCLLARRLAERGVRFIQLYHRDWDMHGGLKRDMPVNAKETDQATAALIKDLKQRGMLDETIVVWCGEFGRTPMAQGDGRDHHIKGFSMFVAGGGFKRGVTYGQTDELGYNAVENVVEVHDLHATILHLLGVDHERLTFRVQGRDYRLTDTAGHVVKEILA
jgi:hypothetical protein